MSETHHNPGSLLKRYHFVNEKGEPSEEKAELVSEVPEKTGYPAPDFRYRIVLEELHPHIEEAYFWTLDELEMGWSFNKFDKITDIHAASEESAFFGVSEQRLGMQQDKASQYLRGISDMLKALFQIVRELRIMDERLGYYKHTFTRKNETESVGSDITLKGVWVDQVEGGTKNAASVYGLAQTVGFSVLPDLFFRLRANDRGGDKVTAADYDAFVKRVIADSDRQVDKMEGFNEKVKEVVKRKLTQYYMWKMRTYKELEARRKFTIKYLRQHYDTIKLYMGWIKPYLRNIMKLRMAEKLLQGEKSRELITAFEGSLIEIEVLSYKQKDGRVFFPCVLVNLFYRSEPAMTYVQEGYQRGPAHSGKFDMTLRGYVWNEQQIENYKRMKEEEDLNMLSIVDESIKASMDALGDELKHYLKEAGEEFPEDEKHEVKKLPSSSALEPFIGIFGGIKDIFGSLKPADAGKPNIKKKLTGGKTDIELDTQITEAKAELKTAIYQTYKNYKKLHGMVLW